MRVKALYDQVLFREERNPFIKQKTESGLFIPEGMSFTNETGDIEQMDKIIGFGIVVEVGGECKYVKQGDAIFYDRRSIRAVPTSEVLWNMSERGMVGYISSDDPGLQAAFAEHDATEAQIALDLQAKAKADKLDTEKRVQALTDQRIAEGREFKSSPLIKIK